MAFVAPEAAEALGASSESLGAGAESSGAKTSKGGLSTTQKAAAFGRSLPKPKTNHPYIVGITLIAIGAFGLVGSINGSLPSMIAALFVPDALIDPAGANASQSLLDNLGHGLAVAADPLTLITGGL